MRLRNMRQTPIRAWVVRNAIAKALQTPIRAGVVRKREVTKCGADTHQVLGSAKA
ncbi:MAG: hypothetical protein KBD41_13665 [Saprospiraceae bacterium]|nr:hypothetical protein [Saprospiraceae bacterium]